MASKTRHSLLVLLVLLVLLLLLRRPGLCQALGSVCRRRSSGFACQQRTS